MCALNSTPTKQHSSRLVDAHIHVWSTDPFKYPFGPHDGMSSPVKGATVEEFSAASSAAETSEVILIQPRVYGYDHGYLYDAGRSLKGNARVVPTLNVVRSRATEDLRRFASDPLTAAFRVIALGDADADWLSWATAQQTWEAASQLSLPVAFLIEAHNLPQVKNIVADHPDLTVVIDHMARCSPGLQRDFAPHLYDLAEHPNVYIKLSAVDRLSEGEFPFKDMWSLIAGLYREYGPSRLLWGSDWPYLRQSVAYEQSFVPIREALPAASERDFDIIFAGTATSLFRLYSAELKEK